MVFLGTNPDLVDTLVILFAVAALHLSWPDLASCSRNSHHSQSMSNFAVVGSVVISQMVSRRLTNHSWSYSTGTQVVEIRCASP